MNNIKWIIIGLVSIVLIVALTYEDTKMAEIKNAKYDDCVNLMNKFLPDPNDDSRPSFLQNCYER